jgi:predicted dehydrogenase
MLKGAIIGTGKIAMTGHMPAYTDKKLKGKIKITAAVDTSEDRRSEFAKIYPDIKTYSSIDELFNHTRVDFIDICSPPRYRNELVELAVENGVNILCEKPFAITLESAQRQKALLESNCVSFMPCHQYKYSPVWLNIKKAAEKYSVSSKVFLQFNVFRLEADKGFTPSHQDWRTDASLSGGGILADTGVHYIYLSLWMLGKPLRITSNLYNLKRKDYAVEDTAVTVLEFEKGIAEINLTWAADRRVNSARLTGADGSIYYNGKSLIRYKNENKKKIPVPDASDKSTYISYYVSLIEDFRKMIKNKKDSTPFVDEAFDSVRVLKACYLSAELNKAIDMPLKD